jgi:ABC-2 type transport system ATP-binding protein
MDDFVSVNKLTKNYGDVCAVDNLSFTVRQGEIFGFLGPNGAGKSTTLHVLTTLTGCQKGDIRVGGYRLKGEERKIKQIIGMVPQEIAVYDTLSAYENVKFFASLYGLRGRSLKNAALEALEFVGLSQHKQQRAQKMSGGMRRRLNIACGIVHSPKLIVMDEPTVGVDPQSRELIMESIRTLRSRGATIIYTSHYMPEVQEICDRIAIIDHGKMVACGTETELISLVTDTKSIYIETRLPQEGDLSPMKGRLGVIPGVRAVTVKESELRIDVEHSFKSVTPILKALMDEGLPIDKLSSESPNLETTFLALTGNELA